MPSVDVELAVSALALDVEVKGHEALGLCPMHFERTGKQDRAPSWWINLSTGQHTCFSCGYKGSLLQLICDVKDLYVKSWGDDHGYDYDAAKAWLGTVTDISPEKLAETLRNLPHHIEPLPKPLEMSEARLAVFVDPPLEHLQQRNVSLAATRAYEIMWDATRSAWVLPFRNPTDRKLLGWQEKGTLARTFMNRPPGLPRSKTLFGLNMLQEDLVYLVESPLDCARLMTAGFPGALAICGSTINEDQIKLIRGADRVIAAFDNPKVDSAGKKASSELSKWARKYGMNLMFFNYGTSGKKDPGDLTDVEIAWGIEHAISDIYGERAYV